MRQCGWIRKTPTTITRWARWHCMVAIRRRPFPILKSTSRVSRRIRAADSRSGVARFYLADYEAAAKDLRAVADKPETAPGAHYFLGRIARLQDNLPEAENQLKQAVAADPRFADALAELGQSM